MSESDFREVPRDIARELQRAIERRPRFGETWTYWATASIAAVVTVLVLAFGPRIGG